MTTHSSIQRAPRSTRVILADAERRQSDVIATLIAADDTGVAVRLQRCQRDRRYRQPDVYPWRCGSGGCWSCRRNLIRKWWSAFCDWLPGPDTSLAVIPASGDPISTIRRLRRGLRDVRDRTARQDRQWAGVAFVGLLSEQVVMVLVSHSGLDRADVWWALSARWPEVVLVDVGTAVPSSRMTIGDAATLAGHRRGIEPIRIVIMPQVAVASAKTDDTLPMAF